MHKKIKRIIALTLVIGAISYTGISDNFINGNVKVYASTYSGAVNGELTSLTITRSTGSEIKLSDSYYGNEVSLSAITDYYLELTGADGFQIASAVKGDGYVIKQFDSADKTAKGEDAGEYIKIDSSSENIYLRTYRSEEDYKEAYDNEDVTDCEKTYVIHVKKPAVNSDEELDVDHACLDKLYISNGNIEFSKNQYSYDVNVGEDVKEVIVRATPENDKDTVEINGESAQETENYEKTVSLNEGSNKIEVYVENDDDHGTYVLNVFRGNASASSTSSTQTSTSSTQNTQSLTVQSGISKYNSWQQVDGKLKYIDGTGEVLKSKWWFDKDTGKNYYLKEDGSRATGWLHDNSNWYYFSENGEMKTGWISLDGSWYYLNKSGVMHTGWLQDSTGKWYYLDGSGKMIN